MKKRSVAFWIGLSVLVILWLYFLYAGKRAGDAAVKVGDIAPAFTVVAEDGRTVTSESLKGKTVLLHFWATWCGPCKDELPELEKFLETLKDRPNFIALAVSEDLEGKKETDPFRARYKIKMPFYFDPESKAADAFGTFQIPETYLIDPSGKVMQKWIGAVSWSDPRLSQAFSR